MRSVSSLALVRGVPRAGMFAIALVGAGPAQAAATHATFVQAAMRDGMFQTFLGLVDKAQAGDRLNTEPATVFMPTDAAFKQLTSAQRDAIAALSPEEAKRFVGHFVVPGVALKSNNINQDITAEDGTSYNVTWFGGRLSLRDHRGPATGPLAFVVDGDNPAGASMIDAVDSVLVPAFLDRPTSPNTLVAVSALQPIATAVPSSPPSASSVPSVTTPAPTPPVLPLVPAASTSASTAAPGDVTFSDPKPTQPAAPPQPTPPPPPSSPIVTSAPAKPDLNITTADLRGWPVRTSGNGPSGKVDRVVVGVPSGRIAGLTATFGGFFGFGGKRVFIAWPLVTVDPQGKAIRVRMTADGLKSAPSSPPAP